jgi:hypothetical protein
LSTAIIVAFASRNHVVTILSFLVCPWPLAHTLSLTLTLTLPLPSPSPSS